MILERCGKSRAVCPDGFANNDQMSRPFQFNMKQIVAFTLLFLSVIGLTVATTRSRVNAPAATISSAAVPITITAISESGHSSSTTATYNLVNSLDVLIQGVWPPYKLRDQLTAVTYIRALNAYQPETAITPA